MKLFNTSAPIRIHPTTEVTGILRFLNKNKNISQPDANLKELFSINFESPDGTLNYCLFAENMEKIEEARKNNLERIKNSKTGRSHGYHELIEAIDEKDLGRVKKLLADGVNPNAHLSHYDKRAIECSVRNFSLAVPYLIAAGADLSIEDIDGSGLLDILHYGARDSKTYDSTAFVLLLSGAERTKPGTPLGRALYYNSELVSQYIEFGEKPSLADILELHDVRRRAFVEWLGFADETLLTEVVAARPDTSLVVLCSRSDLSDDVRNKIFQAFIENVDSSIANTINKEVLERIDVKTFFELIAVYGKHKAGTEIGPNGTRAIADCAVRLLSEKPEYLDDVLKTTEKRFAECFEEYLNDPLAGPSVQAFAATTAVIAATKSFGDFEEEGRETDDCGGVSI